MWRGQEEGSYYCLLAFEDYLAFLIDHQISDHHEAATPPLMEVIAEESIEWVDPIQGAAPLPPTEPQEPPAEAPAIAATYHQMLRVQLADWWKKLR
jgi:hypothetical protein